jgi:hypothetical protein
MIFLAGKKHARNFVEFQRKNYNCGRLHILLVGLTPKKVAESAGKLN